MTEPGTLTVLRPSWVIHQIGKPGPDSPPEFRWLCAAPAGTVAYASAMVNAAKKEPDGLGSVAEDAVLAGQFYVPDEQKVNERGQEQFRSKIDARKRMKLAGVARASGPRSLSLFAVPPFTSTSLLS